MGCAANKLACFSVFFLCLRWLPVLLRFSSSRALLLGELTRLTALPPV